MSTYDSLVRRFHKCMNDIHCKLGSEKYSCHCHTGTAYEHCKLQHGVKHLILDGLMLVFVSLMRTFSLIRYASLLYGSCMIIYEVCSTWCLAQFYFLSHCIMSVCTAFISFLPQVYLCEYHMHEPYTV